MHYFMISSAKHWGTKTKVNYIYVNIILPSFWPDNPNTALYSCEFLLQDCPNVCSSVTLYFVVFCCLFTKSMKFKETQVLSTNMLGDPCKFLMPSVKSCVCFILLIYLVLDKIWAIPVSRLTDRIITHIRSKTIILKFSQLRGVSFAGHYHCGKSVFYSCFHLFSLMALFFT